MIKFADKILKEKINKYDFYFSEDGILMAKCPRCGEGIEVTPRDLLIADYEPKCDCCKDIPTEMKHIPLLFDVETALEEPVGINLTAEEVSNLDFNFLRIFFAGTKRRVNIPYKQLDYLVSNSEFNDESGEFKLKCRECGKQTSVRSDQINRIRGGVNFVCWKCEEKINGVITNKLPEDEYENKSPQYTRKEQLFINAEFEEEREAILPGYVSTFCEDAEGYYQCGFDVIAYNDEDGMHIFSYAC